ncbi:hypothetical protein [Kistimonas asteriae]|nr:hypothetical protein [Kistimonas asteriae]
MAINTHGVSRSYTLIREEGGTVSGIVDAPVLHCPAMAGCEMTCLSPV